MGIRATDNEALATELWGDDKVWDDERKQFVPTARYVGEAGPELVDLPKGAEVTPSPGRSSKPSGTATAKPSSKSGATPRPNARTTAHRSRKVPGGNSTARSTDGSGTA